MGGGRSTRPALVAGLQLCQQGRASPRGSECAACAAPLGASRAPHIRLIPYHITHVVSCNVTLYNIILVCIDGRVVDCILESRIFCRQGGVLVRAIVVAKVIINTLGIRGKPIETTSEHI